MEPPHPGGGDPAERGPVLLLAGGEGPHVLSHVTGGGGGGGGLIPDDEQQELLYFLKHLYFSRCNVAVTGFLRSYPNSSGSVSIYSE